MVESDLLELHESFVDIAPALDQRRLDGKTVHGEVVPIQCHIETQRRRVRNQTGDEVTASGRCLCVDVYPWVSEDSELTMPDGSSPRIVAVETTYGLNVDTGANGPYQTVVYFGG